MRLAGLVLKTQDPNYECAMRKVYASRVSLIYGKILDRRLRPNENYRNNS